MSKMARNFPSKEQKSSLKAGNGVILDQNEVMRAMLAQAQKGKGKQVEEDSEDGNDSDEDGDEGPEGDEGNDSAASEASSQAESSASAQLRQRSRNRSSSRGSAVAGLDEEVKDSELDSRTAGIRGRNSSAPSRVHVSRDQASFKVVSPFTTAKPPATTTFASLGLSQPLINALASINIKKPTEIQSACVGPILSGRSSE